MVESPIKQSTFIEKANDLFFDGQYDEAKIIYESISDLIDNYDAVHTYGLCLVRLQKPLEALDIFERIVKKYKTSGEAWYSLGRTYLILDNTKKSIEALLKAKKLSSDDSQIYFYLGLAYEKEKNFQKAIENYLISLELDNYYKTHINLALCYFDIDNLSLALKHIKAAYNLEKNDLDCYRYYAYILIKSGKSEEAYNLLLNCKLNYDTDLTILEMMIYLSLDYKDFLTADKIFIKLKNLNSEYYLVHKYKELREKAKS